VAGIVDEIGIVELIDELISSHELEKTSASQIVKAIILKSHAVTCSKVNGEEPNSPPSSKR
jgi:hypothetical protein